MPVITNKINPEGLVNSPVDRLNKKEIVDDEINPEIPEMIITNEIYPEDSVDELNKEEIVNDIIPEIPINSSVINTEMPVNSPMDRSNKEEIVNDVIPEIPINSSVNKSLSENKITIDEKKPEVPVNSLDNKKLNKNEMIDKIKNIEKPVIIDQIPSYETINPEGPNSEIYKKNILLGQKILIVMTLKIFFPM